MRIKQSVSAPTFMYSAGMTFERVAEAAADIGYAGVEVWGADELAAQCEFAHKLGLRMTSFIGTGEPLNDPAVRDEAVQTMVKCIDMAADLDIPGLICICGDRREGVSDAQGIIDTAEALKAAAPRAEEKGVTLIAISSHGHSGIKKWVFGSIANKVVLNSKSPVLVVRALGEKV